jgi:transcriptional regulator of aromatic amino acid metabolism
MPPLHAPDIASFSELMLLLSLSAQQNRPNLLISCTDAALDAVLTQLHALCASPVHECALPGPLTLPKKPAGTLLLHHVEALTIDQQIALYDWMTGARQVQVVSITAAPLLWLMEHGQFLEGLFYRLNTVCLMASGSDAHWESPVVDNMQIAWWRR